MDFREWAHRRASKGQPQQQGQKSTPQGGGLPPPPDGYGYVLHPEHGPVLVSLASLATAPQTAPAAIPAPYRQPGGVPMGPPPALPGAPGGAAVAGPPVETCSLVKPGDIDTYAEFLKTVPDIVPPSGYDSMSGRMSPETARELARSGIAMSRDDDLPVSFKSSAHQPMQAKQIKDL